MKIKIIPIFLLLCALSQLADAKRAAPPQLSPVVQDNIEYFPRNSPAFYLHAPQNSNDFTRYATCPNDGVCITAWDLATNRELWTLKVYSIEINWKQEVDVQDVPITEIYFKNRKLIIKSERNDTFIVDTNKKFVVPEKTYKNQK